MGGARAARTPEPGTGGGDGGGALPPYLRTRARSPHGGGRVYGTAAFTTAAGHSPDAQERDEVVGRIRDVEGLPHTAAAAETLADYGSEEQFRRSVRALLTGLAATH